jgi:hypothetical protein
MACRRVLQLFDVEIGGGVEVVITENPPLLHAHAGLALAGGRDGECRFPSPIHVGRPPPPLWGRACNQPHVRLSAARSLAQRESVIASPRPRDPVGPPDDGYLWADVTGSGLSHMHAEPDRFGWVIAVACRD